MKKMNAVFAILMAALLMLTNVAPACAASLTERLDAVEAELGISGEGSLADRISAAEKALGINASADATSADRVAALERDLGFASADADKPGTPLDSLDAFSVSYVSTYFSIKQYVDSYNGSHTATIFPECTLGFGDSEIEYLLGGAYTTLRGVFYIPKNSLPNIDAIDILRAKVLIYGDDELIYTMPSLGLKDEPLEFSVDVSGVKFLKIAFQDAAILNGPYIVMGDAELVK